MEKNPLEHISAEDRARFGVIETRPDLFETKVLRVSPEAPTQSEQQQEILIASRDPGSANAILPVMKALQQERGYGMTAVTDGRAQEIFQKTFRTEDITPPGMILEADTVMPSSDVILTDSSTSNIGLETYAAATFNEVPTVLVEDYYTASFDYLNALIERKLPLPEKICVMDEAARDLVVHKFPSLAERVVVTGQPAFDRFAQEPTEKIQQATREKLQLNPDDKLVSFMSTFTFDYPSSESAIQALAEQFATMEPNAILAFRRHPRDNTPYETYDAAFRAHGIRTIDTNAFSTDEINAASDLIVTTWSTEGLNAIYRRKPTIHVIDSSITAIPDSLVLPIPPVKLGASLGINSINELGATMRTIGQPSSMKALRDNMEKHYPLDGKNSARVVGEIKNVLSTRHTS